MDNPNFAAMAADFIGHDDNVTAGTMRRVVADAMKIAWDAALAATEARRAESAPEVADAWMGGLKQGAVIAECLWSTHQRAGESPTAADAAKEIREYIAQCERGESEGEGE